MTLARLFAVLAVLAGVGLVLFFAAVIFVMTSEVFQGNAFNVDFAAFWGAGRLAVEGNAVAAFEKAAMDRVIVIPPDYPQQGFPWMYPPTWHLAVTPFGALPFWAAWPLFAALALVLYLAALRRWAVVLPGGLSLVIAAPVVLLGTVNGNTGLVMAGLMVLALTALAAGRPARAGLLIALMTVKPTVGLLIPLALAAGGHWRAFLWATAGTVVLALVATLVFGTGYWQVFFARLAEAGQEMATGGIPLQVMVSWYGFGRALELGHQISLGLQGAVLLGLAGVILRVWARPGSIAMKGAILLVAIPLATPYAHFYEMAFTLAGLVLWVHAGAGRRPVEQAMIAALWLLPALVAVVRDPPVVAWLGAPMGTGLLAVMLWQARARP